MTISGSALLAGSPAARTTQHVSKNSPYLDKKAARKREEQGGKVWKCQAEVLEDAVSSAEAGRGGC